MKKQIFVLAISALVGIAHSEKEWLGWVLVAKKDILISPETTTELPSGFKVRGCHNCGYKSTIEFFASDSVFIGSRLKTGEWYVNLRSYPKQGQGTSPWILCYKNDPSEELTKSNVRTCLLELGFQMTKMKFEQEE
jgi:hypothetical protein